jgi:transposase
MKVLPKWVKKQKTKGTEVRKFGDKYYLYQITSKWDSEKKRARKVTLGFLGAITPDGLIKPKVEKIKESVALMTIREWGAYGFIEALNRDIREHLQACFPNYWKELWIAAQLRFIHQAPIKNWSYHYEHSYLYTTIPEAKMNSRNLGNTLKAIGSERGNITELLKRLSVGHAHIIIDTTHVVSRSGQIDIAKVGYNNAHSFEPQVNLLYIFSTDKKVPVYYRLLPGNLREISAMKLSIEDSGLKDVVLVGDKGFYSEANVNALADSNIKYLLPLRRNHALLNYDCIATGDKEKLQGHFMFNGRAIWFYNIGSSITVFIDEQLKVQESSDYLARIQEKYEGYTKQEYMKMQHQFGTLSIASNVPNLSAQAIYERYKSRGAIEQAFDAYKNTLQADATYMHGTEQMEAWSLINFLALIFYYRTYNALLEAKLLSSTSVADVLIRARELKKINIANLWKNSEISKKTAMLLLKLAPHIT